MEGAGGSSSRLFKMIDGNQSPNVSACFDWRVAYQ